MTVEIEHVGIVVDDLAEAQRFATDVLGLQLLRETRIPGQRSIAFYTAGPAELEFIEVHDADRSSRLGNALANIDHVAFRVCNVEAACDELRALGVRFASDEPRTVGGLRSYFSDPESTDGVVYQFFDRGDLDEQAPVGTNRLIRFDKADWRARGAGLRTVYVAEPAVGASTFLNGFTEMPPGGSLPLHRHNCDESVTLIEGRAVVEIEAEQTIMDPFDTSFIRAGVAHRFINAGDDRLRIHWTYGSVNATRTIVATGECTSIEAERTLSTERPDSA